MLLLIRLDLLFLELPTGAVSLAAKKNDLQTASKLDYLSFPTIEHNNEHIFHIWVIILLFGTK